MLVTTSCMAWTVENQAEVDDTPHQLVKRSASDCINATIYPTACGANCSFSFFRYGPHLGVTFTSRGTVTGIDAITSISGASTVTFSASTTKSGTIITYARIADFAGSFYSTIAVDSTINVGGHTLNTTIPSFPNSNYITKINTNDFVTRNNVTHNAGNRVIGSAPFASHTSISDGGITSRICAPI